MDSRGKIVYVEREPSNYNWYAASLKRLKFAGQLLGVGVPLTVQDCVIDKTEKQLKGLRWRHQLR
jgi:hypothetical protein